MLCEREKRKKKREREREKFSPLSFSFVFHATFFAFACCFLRESEKERRKKWV